MTALLEKALAEIPRLPPPQQEEVASWLLAELEDEARWAESFSLSGSTLERLADADPGLRFKPVHPSRPIYSVRIGIH